MDFLDILLGLPSQLGELGDTIIGILTSTLSLPVLGDISLWAVLGGAGLVIIIITNLLR